MTQPSHDIQPEASHEMKNAFIDGIPEISLEDCKAYLEERPDTVEWCTDKHGTTALIKAISFKRNDLVLLFLESGASPDKGNNYGMLPIHVAGKYDNVDAVDLLLAFNAKIDAENLVGKTALSFATQLGHRAVTTRLIERKADVNHLDKNMESPILIAIDNNNTDICIDLIRAGADITVKDKLGFTPLSLCKWRIAHVIGARDAGLGRAACALEQAEQAVRNTLIDKVISAGTLPHTPVRGKLRLLPKVAP